MSALIAETPMNKGFEANYEGMRAKTKKTFIGEKPPKYRNQTHTSYIISQSSDEGNYH